MKPALRWLGAEGEEEVCLLNSVDADYIKKLTDYTEYTHEISSRKQATMAKTTDAR
jgi:hypothetical protein